MRVLTLSTFVLWTSFAFATLAKGNFTSLDQWGGSPPLDEQENAYAKYLEQTKRGGKLIVAASREIDLIWPGHFKKSLELKTMPYSTGFVYESLMMPDPARPGRQLNAAIAKSFIADPDTKTYILNLDEAARFADGTPVTAEDVVNSFAIHQTELFGPIHEHYWKALWGTLKLSILSAHKLELQFPDVAPSGQREALYGFLANVWIVKKNPAPPSAVKVPYEYIGTGPYAVTAATREFATLRRRPDYWFKKTPMYNFDEITMTVIRDKVVQREAMKRKDLNLYIERDIRAERELEPSVQAKAFAKHVLPTAANEVEMGVLYMNLDREHMRDPGFRKAVLLALDFETTNRMLYAKKLVQMPTPGAKSSFSPKGNPSESVKRLIGDETMFAEARNKAYEDYGYGEVAKISGRRERLLAAASILKKAGYVVDPTTLRLMRNGVPVSLSLLETMQDGYSGMYQLFKADLQRLGIELNIRQPSDSAAFIREIKSRNHDFVRNRLEFPHAFTVLDVDILAQRLLAQNAEPGLLNFSMIRSKSMDEVIGAMRTSDPASAQYKDAVDALLRMYSALTPVVMLGEPETTTVYSDFNICLPPNSNSLIQAAYFCSERTEFSLKIQ